MIQSDCTRPLLRAKTRRRRPLIGMTPMIDVVFILLIFFMLTSSFLDWRAIEMNTPAKAASTPSQDAALKVVIAETGLTLSGEAVSMEALVLRAAQETALDPDKRFLVEPAPGISFQRTVEVLDSLKSAKVSNVSLAKGKQQ
jgi:biopolymer transport protein ExbD